MAGPVRPGGADGDVFTFYKGLLSLSPLNNRVPQAYQIPRARKSWT